jgi:hypothetical protein
MRTDRAVATGALAAALLLQAGLGWGRRFHVDEWQHLHASWCIAQGLLPYRDFFEHHSPGLWYLLAPWMAWARPELDPERAVALLHAVRLPFVAVWAAVVTLTWRLTRTHTGRTAPAWIAAVLLATTPMFADKMADIRPDGIAVSLALVAWIALIRGIREPGGATGRFFVAGLALGGAVLFTQKILLAVPAVAACLLLYTLGGDRAPARLRGGILLGVGFSLPILALLAAFASIGQLGTFLEFNVWLNLRWVRVVPRLFSFWTLLRESPFLVLAGAAGFFLALRGLRDPVERAQARYVVPFLLAGYSAMQMVSPAPWPQYLLNHMPLLAVLAGEGLVRASAASWPRLAWPATLLLGVVPGLAVTLAGFQSNGEQFRGVRYVQSITEPSDTVLDGVTGYGVFRPHAFFYPHVNWDIRGMIPAERRAELEDGLVSGRIAPRVVLLDDDIAYLSEAATAYVRGHYRPGAMADVWVRDP